MSGLPSGDNQIGKFIPQMMMMMKKVPPLNPYQMMMFSSVLKQKMQSLIRGLIFQSQLLNVQEIWKRKVLHLMSLMKIKGPRCLLNHVNHPYIPGKTKVKPSTGEPSTSRHQALQKTHKKSKKSKKSKGDKKTNKTVGTNESPMSIDDDGQAEESDLPKKRKGFAYYPLLTYKKRIR